jgi:flagellar basal-body rod modification protein FlgD
MSISDIINGTAGAGATNAAGAATKKEQLGQGEFLELMIAQLRNQDPFKAMDPSQFLGQLAQFGTVTGIQEMQTAFAGLSESMRASQVLDGSTMIGRQVLVEESIVQLGASGGIDGNVDVPPNANDVKLNIKDASGQLVRQITLPTTAGTSEISWDGLDARGERAPAGEYDFEVVASVGGATGSLPTYFNARVDSVTIDSARGLMLNTNTLGTRTLGEVRRVM